MLVKRICFKGIGGVSEVQILTISITKDIGLKKIWSSELCVDR